MWFLINYNIYFLLLQDVVVFFCNDISVFIVNYKILLYGSIIAVITLAVITLAPSPTLVISTKVYNIVPATLHLFCQHVGYTLNSSHILYNGSFIKEKYIHITSLLLRAGTLVTFLSQSLTKHQPCSNRYPRSKCSMPQHLLLR